MIDSDWKVSPEDEARSQCGDKRVTKYVYLDLMENYDRSCRESVDKFCQFSYRVRAFSLWVQT